MNNRTVGLLRTAVAVGGGLAVAASATLIAIGRAGEWWSNFGALHALFSLFFALFVWFVAAKQPRNAVVWTMAACAFFSGVKVAGRAGALLVIDDPNVVLGPAATYVPADLPPLAATRWASSSVWSPGRPSVAGVDHLADGRRPASRIDLTMRDVLPKPHRACAAPITRAQMADGSRRSPSP